MRDRNDNLLVLPAQSNPRQFVSYLWGIETLDKRIKKIHCWLFVSYLWGIETDTIWIELITTFKPVCILPMRDRNYVKFRVNKNKTNSLYLTYEGSKPIDGGLTFPPSGVCILPMRDRNAHGINSMWFFLDRLYLTYEGSKLGQFLTKIDIKEVFVSYLWGIETQNGVWKLAGGHRFVSYLWGIET